MRRLAFLVAASLAFVAISEPPSAEAQMQDGTLLFQNVNKCKRGCGDKFTKKYGRDWRIGDLSPAEQRSLDKCRKDCDGRDPQRGGGRKQLDKLEIYPIR